MLIDSHAHLDMRDYDQDREEVIARALQGGLSHIISIGIDFDSSVAALKLAKKHARIFSTVGFHPHDAKHANPGKLQELSRLSAEPKVVAWGEIGLDFFHRHSEPQTQLEIFERQLDLALDCDKPVIIHSRDAHEEVFAVIKKHKKPNLRGVIHCFSGDYTMAMRFIDLGFYISFPGVVTFPKATQARDAAARLPLEKLLVETDAPFLAPIPFRGKRNEPLYVTHTAQKIAELRGISYEDFCRQTAENTKSIFNLPEKESV
ncbi:MAG: TatD family deoxyribonuclease [Desulfobacteraceae bacterium]|nr:MAG: TatD family deoxyribonuclease [Desulfobacteraceae bacterium]